MTKTKIYRRITFIYLEKPMKLTHSRKLQAFVTVIQNTLTHSRKLQASVTVIQNTLTHSRKASGFCHCYTEHKLTKT